MNIPDDLGGFQNVVCGPVEEGDILVVSNYPKVWLNAYTTIGTDIADLSETLGWRVYRRMPIPKEIHQ